MRNLLSAGLLLGVAACAPAASAGAAQAPADECRIAPGTLVNVRAADRTIRTDVRYATRNNFTADVLPGYERPLAMLRPDAAQASVEAMTPWPPAARA